MNLHAENKVLKNDLLNGDTSLLETREDLAKMTDAKQKLDAQVMELTAQSEID